MLSPAEQRGEASRRNKPYGFASNICIPSFSNKRLPPVPARACTRAVPADNWIVHFYSVTSSESFSS